MFPASRRSRALELCLLAAVLNSSACASTGPGTTPVSTPGPLAQSVAESPIPGVSSAIPGADSPAQRADSPRPRELGSSKPRLESAKRRPESAKRKAESAQPRAESATPKAASLKPKAESAKPKVVVVKRRPHRAVPRTRADSIALELAFTKRLAHQPLAVALAKRMRNPELADRVAAAVVYEAGRLRMSPSLLAGVLIIENTPFDTIAVSTQGAIGLMQVMPVHVGSYGCLSGDLLNVEANICHGARLLGAYLRRTKSVELALRRYNGCVSGRNTPRCHRYPIRVLSTASRLRREVLVTAAKLTDESAEDPETLSSRLGADLGPHIEASDSTEGTAAEPNECSTFVGCLRRRWSSTR
jgi:soluble lytic murein transglycosylase-like protein